jgi:hypothetical protein
MLGARRGRDDVAILTIARTGRALEPAASAAGASGAMAE